MPPVTRGRLLVTPATLNTKASLSQLAAAMNEDRLPRGSVLNSGWGALTDDETRVGLTGPVPFRGGEAIVVAEDGEVPEHVRGRLYWRQTSPAAIKFYGKGADQEQLLELRAADIFISRTGEDGKLLVLMTLKDAVSVKRQVTPYLTETVRTVDPAATLLTSDTVLTMGDGDFFRWLLWRTYNKPELSDTLTILELINLHCQDQVFRTAALSGGIDMDRMELLTLIMRDAVGFGPATFTLSDTVVGLDAQIQLWADGSFACTLGETGYDEPSPRAEKGIRVTLDLAHEVLPELRRAYNADNDWRTTHRAQSIQEAGAALLAAHTLWLSQFPTRP
ncbi:hypothetical protein SAMN05660748_1232 [Blastococcus aggregatus]|uniref:Uncharacterized protein n=1 Tax=Blastococcus aggregatus TaxID=38502 RepID=A0A285V675_9ACTN|nr:hypothetical protein [Blastococcus aggregatus]SOC48536.1 hypothetical protein SAMN05660748_1232 [Blastococcus aggregatus]